MRSFLYESVFQFSVLNLRITIYVPIESWSLQDNNIVGRVKEFVSRTTILSIGSLAQNIMSNFEDEINEVEVSDTKTGVGIKIYAYNEEE